MSKAKASLTLAALLLSCVCGWVRAEVISPGTPTTTVPTYLSDGSYPFGFPVSLGPDQFLLPVEITGAVNLQNWVFDLTFDNTVVQVVDPGDGTSGIYGARFVPGNPDSLSFILAGLPLNFLGTVFGVGGEYPSLLSGPSDNGILAFVEFEFLPDQQSNNPNFAIENAAVQEQVPEPTTSTLLAAGLLLLAARHLRRVKPRTAV